MYDITFSKARHCKQNSVWVTHLLLELLLFSSHWNWGSRNKNIINPKDKKERCGHNRTNDHSRKDHQEIFKRMDIYIYIYRWFSL